MNDKKIIYCMIFLVIVIAILWKLVYKNGFKKESAYLDGSYYVVPEWQDSWPNNW